MQWFKHDTDASTDARIKKLILRYGPTGYAVYFHCLELIAGDISESNITFELEHDAEIIADDLKVQGTAQMSAVDLVNIIMRYIVELGLFEEQNSHIFCFKMLKRLDSSMTSNPKMRSMIASAKESHDGVMMESCSNHDTIMQEENRIEEIRIDKNRKEEKPFKMYGSEGVVKIIDDYYANLQRDFPQEAIDMAIEELTNYILTTPKYKKDRHDRVLRGWPMDNVRQRRPDLFKPQKPAEKSQMDLAVEAMIKREYAERDNNART